ncbi:ankyrin repeat domain-containing protein [Verrucomicrobia bacterium]|nr:ankyrin repeat domain-containing protein [Verrucomicrobiota bacterium]
MKHFLLTTIAAVLLVGGGESDHQHSHDDDHAHAEGDHHLAECDSDGHDKNFDSKTAEVLKVAGKPTASVADAAQREPTTVKAPNITIHKTASEGNIEAVKQHIADGADVNAKGVGGRTPLHGAIARDRKETAKLLIAKGADVNAKTADGETPLDLAIQFRELETADLLRKHGGKTGDELKAEGR